MHSSADMQWNRGKYLNAAKAQKLYIEDFAFATLHSVQSSRGKKGRI